MTTLNTVLAHGVGSRGDLPLPFYLFGIGAAVALMATFVSLSFFWHRAWLPGAASGRSLGMAFGRALDVVAVPARLASLAVFVLALASSVSDASVGSQRFGPLTVYVALWVGMAMVAAVFGDVWRVLNPFETIAAAIEWTAGKLGLPQIGDTDEIPGGYWPAVIALGWFLFFELCYHDGTTNEAVAGAMIAYTLGMVGGSAVFGRQWVRQADGFGVLFSLLARMSPLYRDDTGAVRLRAPLSGLTTLTPRIDLLAVLLVVLGGTTFDSLAGSTLWPDLVGTHRGWTATGVNTAGMIVVIAIMAALYYLGSLAVGWFTDQSAADVARRFAHSLVPIALGYTVAHYFSLLVLDGGQNFLRLLSNPFDRGSNWFGTADWAVNFFLVSTDAIAWVQFSAIVVGHIAAVLVAHDRAVETSDASEATWAQRPMLLVMVFYSVVGLWLLQEA
ncbi:MAG: hypothetical protein F4124_12410 [Acidimicrobiia bacterium]|nr:hypothetical protein [bacterium]MXW57299.1 hypothetical protein [Acidimicrobiia bacterium]MXZ86088.1 hypothetical protein [Acidimicrobiia bacterium]MYB74452.1 hypothetical protein [Acidimicrobiia bacterium]MYG71558.1 hypothetical protein [Acidimicrobiia bacterium]